MDNTIDPTNVIHLMGGKGVGKSSLALWFQYGEFIKAKAGVDWNSKTFEIDPDTTLTIYIGVFREPIRHVEALSPYFHVHRALVLCDVMDRASFDDAKLYFESLNRYGRNATLKVLICAKSDTIDPKTRVVSETEIEQLASENNAMLFTLSCLTGEGVDDCFGAVVSEISKQSSVSSSPKDVDASSSAPFPNEAPSPRFCTIC